jgi:hypothetical protein
MTNQARLNLILCVCVVALIGLFFIPTIPLGADYHHFADTRSILALPHALDVLSNIPFFVAGGWGLLWLLSGASRLSFTDQRERIPYVAFFAGVALTGIGSFWYHLAPSNSRLPGDLLPMTCSFVSMAVALFMERVNVRIGLLALTPLLLLGAASIAAWYCSGDYKFYLFVQFFSIVVLTLIVALFPPRYSGVRYLAAAFALFVGAKLFESFDRQIYLSGKIVSGHSLKHVTAGISSYLILRMLQVRHVIAGP